MKIMEEQNQTPEIEESMEDTSSEEEEEETVEEDTEVDVIEIDLTPAEIDVWIGKLVELKEEGKDQTFELDEENELTIRLGEEDEITPEDLDDEE